MIPFRRKTRNRDELTRRGNNVSQLPDHVLHKRNRQLGLLTEPGNDVKHLIKPYVNMTFYGSTGEYSAADGYAYTDKLLKKFKVSSLIYNLIYHGGQNVVEICEKFPELINVQSKFDEHHPRIHPLNAAIRSDNLPAFKHLLRLGSVVDNIYYGDNSPFEYADAVLEYMDSANIYRLVKNTSGMHFRNLGPYYLMIKYYNSLPERGEPEPYAGKYLTEVILSMPPALKDALKAHGIYPRLH
jgi:hypothetical protein